MAETVVCPCCGKTVGAYIPAGGDGTGLRPRWHRDRDGKPCEGRLFVVASSGRAET